MRIRQKPYFRGFPFDPPVAGGGHSGDGGREADPVRPTRPQQRLGTRPLTGKAPLKLDERAGERHGAAGRRRRGLSRRASGVRPGARALQWAITQNNLGGALWTVALRTDDPAILQHARAAVNGAFDVVMQTGQEHHRPYFEQRLQAIDRDIATLSAPQAQRVGP
ncbi:MAG: hypothetical protein HWD60_11280 [Defluviicoccus sp.]|nr:MAG: hypothetical protein HWD60_11280 [Defluviicoccus sp.]